MIEISIKYDTGKGLLLDTFNIPSSWNELNLSQLTFIAKNWDSWKLIAGQNFSLIKVKCQILYKLLPGTKSEVKKRAEVISQMDNQSIYDLASLTSFIIEENYLTKNPLPTITIKGHKLVGPSDRMASITGFEFAFADSQYLKYHKTKDIDALNTLIAILYRKAGDAEKGEIQEPFNHKLVSNYKKIVQGLSSADKQLILLFYIGSRNKIVENNREVFTQENSNSAENNTWIDVIMAMSAGKFGTFNETGSMDFHILLKELANIKKQKSQS